MTPLLSMLAGARAFGLTAFRGLFEPEGAFDALASVTVPLGGAASIDFLGIPSGYKHLQIRATVIGGYVYAFGNYNGDTGGNYINHNMAGDGSSVSAWSSGTATRNYYSIGYNSTYPQVFITDILDYSSTNKNKTIRSLSGTDTNGSISYSVLWSGAWFNTNNAITSISITPSGGNWGQYSSFALYGVK